MLDSCLALLYFLCSILHHQSPQLSFIRPVPGKLLKFCQQFLKHLLMANLREITPPNANGRPDPLRPSEVLEAARRAAGPGREAAARLQGDKPRFVDTAMHAVRSTS